MKTEEDLKKAILSVLRTVASSLPTTDVGREAIVAALDALEAVKTDGAPKSSTIVPRYTQAVNAHVTLREEVSRVHPRDVDGAVDLVVQHLPKFVYYSTYGNLDSEIYLPHVIANMSRKDLGAREQAKSANPEGVVRFRPASTAGNP
jgi:hypothetical protein